MFFLRTLGFTFPIQLTELYNLVGIQGDSEISLEKNVQYP
jgi:hypothetical protein